ncbi:MAG: hypothetical protein WCP14_00940 [bacterium]
MSVSDHQNIQHQIFRIKYTELNEIFLVMALRSFVCGMITIFIPIYLYNIGYSLRDILFLFLIMFSVEFVFEYFSARLRTELGPKHAIAISFPFLIAHMWLLATIQTYNWPLWIPALFGGISLALYWQGYHYDFSKSKHKGQATRDVSKMYIILAVLGAIAPFVGSSVLTYLGFNVLYFIVIFALAFAFIPLVKQKEFNTKGILKLKKLKPKDIILDMVSYGGSGVEATISLVIWPLFIYIILKSYQYLGIITSAALIVTIIVTYFVGRRVTNKNRHLYIRNSSFLDSLIYIMLIFVESFIQVASLNMARSLVSSLRSAPYVSEYYLHADERSRSEYIFYMESAIDFFKILMYAFLIILTFSFTDKEVLIAGLVIGAVGALAASLMPRAKCEMPVNTQSLIAKKIKITPKLRAHNELNR